MDMEKILAKRYIYERLKYLRLNMEKTQEEVAADTCTSRKRIGHLESGRPLKDNEVVLFADYYGISCDELLRGVKTKYYKINQVTGLNNNAIKWLATIKKKQPELRKIVNEVLGNEKIAGTLFQIFYCYSMLHIPSLLTDKDGEIVGRVSLSFENEEVLLKSVMTNFVFDILMEIRNAYEGKRLKQSENAVREMFEELDKRMQEKKKQNLEYNREKAFENRD